MCQEVAAAFDKMLDDIAERIHYVNLLTDAGTALGFNALHAIVLNPHCPNDLSPFDTDENCNYANNDDEEFFKEMCKLTGSGICSTSRDLPHAISKSCG
jgi:hypothetical protein